MYFLLNYIFNRFDYLFVEQEFNICLSDQGWIYGGRGCKGCDIPSPTISIGKFGFFRSESVIWEKIDEIFVFFFISKFLKFLSKNNVLPPPPPPPQKMYSAGPVTYLIV